MTAALRQLGERLDGTVADDPAGSLSAAVMHRGATVWTHAAGWADREQDAPATTDTVYRVGSVTKSFTVACALHCIILNTVFGHHPPPAARLA